jgi:hypothetical protein
MSENDGLFELFDLAFLEPVVSRFEQSESAFRAMVEGIKQQNQDALSMLENSGLPMPIR